MATADLLGFGGTQVSEEVHWAIRQGKIRIPGEERSEIRNLYCEMSSIMKMFIDLYKRMICRGHLSVSRSLLKLLRQSQDPYLPGLPVSIKGSDFDMAADPFLDLADEDNSDDQFWVEIMAEVRELEILKTEEQKNLNTDPEYPD